ncbi:hypothetical protein [Nonomuraea sp. LPB2021202275-12-8]|uniref:hypothetical protein n=1 Tax=Nonomuraea sp. LPB2021202275-12-8 TaxID=3120159 RepID=UPI00300D38C1
MANLVDSVTSTYSVEYGSFSILDMDGLSRLPSALDPQELYALTDEGEIWFAATPNMAIVRSRAGSHHVVRVTLERWDAEPPAEEKGGVGALVVEMFSSSGRFWLHNSSGESSPVLDLGVSGVSWLVRGRRIAMTDPFAEGAGGLDWGGDDDDDDDNDPGFPEEGLEEFVFRFWPAEARD